MDTDTSGAPERADDHAPSLTELVFGRLAADPAIDEVTRNRIWEALNLDADDADDEPKQSAIYLRSIRVRGFRGIGAEASLELPDGPGLTLVVGRNGCGKSSFAEAAELALTGVNRRWEDRPKPWKAEWRNLHDGDDARVELELRTDGDPQPVVIARSWTAIDDLNAGTWTRQRTSAPRETLTGSPYRSDLDLYRPFLPYSELGSLVGGKPSEMYDALHPLLGLGALDEALEALRSRRLELEKAVKQANSSKKELLTELAGVDDQRATEAMRLVRATVPDLAALERLIAGTGSDPADLARLRAQIALELPAAEDVSAARDRVVQARQAEAELLAGTAGSSGRMVRLLRIAREHYDDTGIGPCPVCAEGELTEDWAARTDAAIRELTMQVADADAAKLVTTDAVDGARGLIAPLPHALVGAGDAVVADAAEAWGDWAALRSAEPAILLAELAERHRVVVARVDELIAHATDELARQDEVWQPLTGRLGAWVTLRHTVYDTAAELKSTKAAEEWLKKQSSWFRDQRWAPIAVRAQQVWNDLRQQSNVALGSITLAGASTQRHVELSVTVDEEQAGALGVMSQGELNALGLALFLPRATSAESPFRFVMIDDPVQAMDLTKVDGLARVLDAVARERQVVVFTHDGRLAEAVRRLRIDATVLGVQRRERSEVSIERQDDPAARYLEDARKLASTRDLPAAIGTEMVATCCRSAVEAASEARARRELLGRGVTHGGVDDALAKAQTMHDKVSLAVFLENDRGGDLYATLNNRAGRRASTAVRTIKDAAHGTWSGTLHGLVDEAVHLVDWLRR